MVDQSYRATLCLEKLHCIIYGGYIFFKGFFLVNSVFKKNLTLQFFLLKM